MGAFTARELAELEKLVGQKLLSVKGAERVRWLIIWQKLQAERLKRWATWKY